MGGVTTEGGNDIALTRGMPPPPPSRLPGGGWMPPPPPSRRKHLVTVIVGRIVNRKHARANRAVLSLGPKTTDNPAPIELPTPSTPLHGIGRRRMVPNGSGPRGGGPYGRRNLTGSTQKKQIPAGKESVCKGGASGIPPTLGKGMTRKGGGKRSAVASPPP